MSRQGLSRPDLSRQNLAKPELASLELPGIAQRFAASLFFTLFPSDCRICDAPLIRFSRLPVCSVCESAPRPLQGARCAVCGETLAMPDSHGDDPNAPAPEAQCVLCRRKSPPFTRAVAYGSYEAQLRDLIHLLKFQQVRPASAVLGKLLAETIVALEPSMPLGTMFSPAIAVVPVPLHRRKRAERGFNQAEMIARRALQQLARPQRFELCPGILIRRRETRSQIGLTRHQRRENLRGAFSVTDPGRILNRDILLVDDVFTTGTTASECARVLLRAGAARVWVATVARTLKISDAIAVESNLAMAATG